MARVVYLLPHARHRLNGPSSTGSHDGQLVGLGGRQVFAVRLFPVKFFSTGFMTLGAPGVLPGDQSLSCGAASVMSRTPRYTEGFGLHLIWDGAVSVGTH